MRIEFETGETTIDELTAIIALCASLGGRLPFPAVRNEAMRQIAEIGPDMAEPTDGRTLADVIAYQQSVVEGDRPAPPPPAGNTSADALMQAEEARVSGTVVLDADGIPWDARIHAGTKTQTKGKTWTKLRNVNEVLYGEVHATLQEQYAGRAPNGSTSTGTTGTELAHGGAVEAAQDAPAPPPPPDDATGNADAGANAPTGQETAGNAATAGRFADFPGFVQAVNAIRTPPIPYLELNTFAQTVGVAGGFKDMKDHPELWDNFYGLAGGQ